MSLFGYKPHGFRLSKGDVAVLAAGAAGSWALRDAGEFALVPVFVVIHFFLFCNVFRVHRNVELLWAGLLMANVAAWLVSGIWSWLTVMFCQLPATWALIWWETRQPRYHGVFAQWRNPYLPLYLAGKELPTKWWPAAPQWECSERPQRQWMGEMLPGMTEPHAFAAAPESPERQKPAREYPEGHPLHGVNEIPWHSVHHAYGEADDVPWLLEDLLSPDEETRGHAQWELYGNVFHQGTRYEASVEVLPFLMAMAEWPETPDRRWVVEYMGSLVLGYHEDYFFPGFDAEQVLLQPASIELDPEYGWVADSKVYRAFHPMAARLLPLLDDADPEVRGNAAFLISWVPSLAAEAAPKLRAAIEQATGSVRFDIIVALGWMAREASGLEPMLASSDQADRVAAALGLAMAGRLLGEEHLKALIEGVGIPRDHPALGETRWHEGGVCAFASMCLVHLGKGNEERVADAIIAALPGAPPTSSETMTAAGLSLLGLSGSPASLSPVQRRFLSAVAEHGGWEIMGMIFANYSGMMADFGMPDSRGKLRQYLKQIPGRE